MFNVLELICNRLSKYLVNIQGYDRNHMDKIITLQAKSLAISNRRKQSLNYLHDVEWSAFSQWGEDGIIDWLVERLPGIPTTFIEFGVENYLESNTRMLLYLRNWKGLVFDGEQKNIETIKKHDIYWRYDLTAKCEFIDRGNINALITESDFYGEIGLLSIDIDGNDYWVLEAIDAVNPVIIVCEYNAVFGDQHKLTIPYQANFERTKAHHSNLYFGASLPALIHLAEQKGYVFIGTNSNGVNAFFIRNDKADHILESISEVIGYPSKIREARNKTGILYFASGTSRAQIINDLPLINVCDGHVTTLAKCMPIYSDEWKLLYASKNIY